MDADPLYLAGSVAGSVSAVVGVLWWLLAPRVRDYLETIVLEATQAQAVKLDSIVSRLERHGEALAVATSRLDSHSRRMDRLEDAGPFPRHRARPDRYDD